MGGWYGCELRYGCCSLVHVSILVQGSNIMYVPRYVRMHVYGALAAMVVIARRH